VLLVDDEPDVHAVLRLALQGVQVEGRPLHLLDAGSNDEARARLAEHPEIALILLDVVMETERAGLDLVKQVRHGVGNRNVQIIIVTGQPGYAPQRAVVTEYEIDGYLLKSELTADKIFASVCAALRTNRVLVERELALLRQKQAEEALVRQNRDQLARSQEIAHVGSWLMELPAQRLVWSDETYRIFGLNPRDAEVTYATFLQAIHPEDRAAVESAYGDSLRAGRDAYEIEHRIVCSHTDEVRYVHERCVHERDAEGVAVRSVGTVQDVTEQRRMEQVLATQARQQTAVAELGQLALAGGGLAALFDQAVANVAATLGVDYCKVLELQPDGTSLLLRAGVGWQEGLVGTAVVAAGADSQAGFTLHSKQPVIVDDLQTEVRFRGAPLLHQHGVRSGLNVVIGELDKPFGVLGAHTTRRREFSSDDISFLQAVANVLADAVARTRAEEELRVTNEELEERTKALEEQRNSIAKKNTEINQARQELERKARDLETASKYKSEFLANMSHELRTPLNSILILSQLLSENKEMNLTTKQREFARTIHTSGSDLLELINEILDLSKVESGKMELRIEELSLREARHELVKLFEPLAREKRLEFVAEVAGDLPAVILTDPQRLKQILKNLLSNAFKFTEQGRVTLAIGRPRAGVDLSASGLNPAAALAFSVCDSGIGIPLEQQKIVFEAFRQADGTASRKYGGTGLGLTISRELCKLLGGEIQLVSSPGQGTEFVVYLPEKLAPRLTSAGESALAAAVEERTEEVRSQIRESHERRVAAQAPAAAGSESAAAPAAREEAAEPEQPLTLEAVDAGRKRLLIVEDDARFAQILASIAEERGFSCVLTGSGEEALAAIAHCQPGAVILDLQLPGMDGWTVLERLKASPETRHIPVHIMSVSDSGHEALKRGSIGFLAKPVSNEGILQAFERIESVISKAVGRLLLVEDDPGQRTSIIELIGAGDVSITAVATGREALAALAEAPFDAMILDLGLNDMSGFELLERISQDERIRKVPVIVYTGQDLTEAEEAELRKYAESIIVKGVRSPERLLDETALFLHRVEKDLPVDKQRMLRMTRDNDAVFQDKTILVVDDDMRNVFALSSVLEYAGLNVVVGKNGRDGIAKLEDNPQVNLVLMDIMMPEMDGYQAMREIRQRRKYAKLPIIALTAKAMKGDRAKCIEAGANDYLAKPVDTDKLLSLLRVWLYR